MAESFKSSNVSGVFISMVRSMDGVPAKCKPWPSLSLLD